MIFHVPDFKSFKKPTKLEMVSNLICIVFFLFLLGLILYFKDSFQYVSNLLHTDGVDLVQGIALIIVSFIFGITFVISKVYQKHIKSTPCCKGCSNPLKGYTIDLIAEKIKCRTCGFESTFYQFSDKLFLHYKFLEMQKNKDNDPILMDKIDELLKKFGNFEFSKKGNKNGHSS